MDDAITLTLCEAEAESCRSLVIITMPQHSVLDAYALSRLCMIHLYSLLKVKVKEMEKMKFKAPQLPIFTMNQVTVKRNCLRPRPIAIRATVLNFNKPFLFYRTISDFIESASPEISFYQGKGKRFKPSEPCKSDT